MLLDVATAREVLGIRYCPTCEQDAMILDAGYCPWCLRYPDTGELDFAAAAQDREQRRKQRIAGNAHRCRERQSRCGNCGDSVPLNPRGRTRKFCSDACCKDWWRKKQNADRQAAA